MKYKYDYRFTILQVLGTILFAFVFYFLLKDIFNYFGMKASLRPLIITLAATIPTLRAMLQLDRKKAVTILEENLLLQGFRNLGIEKNRDVYVSFEDISTVKAVVVPFFGLLYIKISHAHSKHDVIITRYYENHIEMISALCGKVKSAKPQATIDTRLNLYTEENAVEQLKKSKRIKKLAYNNHFAFVMQLLLLLSMVVLLLLRLPSVSALRSFDTEQALLKYCLDAEPVAIIQGKQVNLAISATQDDVEMLFYSQQNNVWKKTKMKQVKNQYFLSFTATLHTVEDANESFLYIVFPNDMGTQLEASDSLDSEFVKIQSPERKNWTAFVVVLEEYPEDYRFIVNEQEFSFN